MCGSKQVDSHNQHVNIQIKFPGGESLLILFGARIDVSVVLWRLLSPVMNNFLRVLPA